MKTLIIGLLFCIAGLTAKTQTLGIEKKSTTDFYKAEVRALAKKYKIPTAYGYLKAVVIHNDEVRESFIIFYTGANGEKKEELVTIRIVPATEQLRDHLNFCLDSMAKVRKSTF